ncbi:VIT1/CCC1 transporter family protein [Candidatus Giovannonibacteria bacterium]|nr:VIT1/CCC1 transporter family protein [Candidatus Giovannonibacteria bacterium]
MKKGIDEKLSKKLVLDELFDLTLYRALARFAGKDEKIILDKLIPVEERHFEFWKSFFGITEVYLNLGRKIRLKIITLFCRIFGQAGIHIVLEAIEIYGIKKYLNVWNHYKDEELGSAVRRVLEDEFKHEDEIVSASKRTKIFPERVRDIFLGLNDGLVEILGAVSGFFAAFSNTSSVLIAALTVAVAGSISMAASAFAALSSALEVESTENEKQKFLGTATEDDGSKINPYGSALVVGISYLFGALVPVIPVIFGAKNILISMIASTIVIIAVSYIVAFLSGMDAKKRILLNLLIIFLAVGISYILATTAKQVFHIDI